MLKSAKEPAPAAVETTSEDDAALMRRIAAKDAVAFRQLLDRHTGKALVFMQRMLKHRHDAEDEVQKAFLKVWKEAPRWRPEAKFTTWFYRVLMNQALDALRTRKHAWFPLSDHVEDDAPSPEDTAVGNARSRAVQHALDSLPERQRQAIILAHYEELSQKEAAAVMGISEGALESLLARGRLALKRHITKSWYH